MPVKKAVKLRIVSEHYKEEGAHDKSQFGENLLESIQVISEFGKIKDLVYRRGFKQLIIRQYDPKTRISSSAGK